VLQVKKRGRWLQRFSLDVLSKLPGTAADPFNGVTVDTNGLGRLTDVVDTITACCVWLIVQFGF
jgi:hypothetical protein